VLSAVITNSALFWNATPCDVVAKYQLFGGQIMNFVKVCFYSPTDAQVNCLKNNFKIYIKIDIKTAATCFGAVTIIRERMTRAC
jgi:hypothetical protein